MLANFFWNYYLSSLTSNPPPALFLSKKSRQKLITWRNRARQETSNLTGFDSFGLLEITPPVTRWPEITHLLNLWLATIPHWGPSVPSGRVQVAVDDSSSSPPPASAFILSNCLRDLFLPRPKKEKAPCNSFSQDKTRSAAMFKTDTPFFLKKKKVSIFIASNCFKAFFSLFLRCYAVLHCAWRLIMKAADAALAVLRRYEGLQTNESVLQHAEEMSSSSVAVSPLALRLEFSHAWRRH